MSKQKMLISTLALGSIACALATGGVYAFWHDSEDVSALNVTSGNLDVAVVNDNSGWYDVSSDVDGTPKKIDMGAFKIVPGDKLQYRAGFSLALEGDNLKANLVIDSKAKATGELVKASADAEKGVAFKYELFKADAEGNPTGDALAMGEGATGDHLTKEVTLSAADAARVVITPQDKANYVAVVTVDFDKRTPERELVQKQASLADLKIDLTQTRP